MGTRKTILIVDDAAMFRDLESLFLARSGRILTAAGGEEGLAMARRHRPDLILADAFMPGIDGEALCRAVRADPDLAATRVLVLSSSESAEDRARALRAGADDVLAKPLSRIELVEAVQRFLRFPQVRGLPRVPFRARVQIDDGSTDWLTTARNLSRGGIFVESEKEMALRSEVTLAFALPEIGAPVTPTAQVVWLDRGEGGGTRGMGLRFLGLDGRTARFIEEWVRERTALPAVGGMR